MSDCSTKDAESKTIIDAVEVTSDILTGRAGLSLFVRYLRNIGLQGQLETFFGSLRRSRKGQPIMEVFKQLFCFFVDGTSRHLVHFDALCQDEGYARVIESDPKAMLSSHAVKRFFGRFWWPWIYLFRQVLQRLFLWRLGLAKPEVVILGIDTMVMDNDEAAKRHGVRPTYKNVKGFQPLQMSWGRLIVDAVFRRGDAHSNHSDTVEKMVRHMVGKIRKHYRGDVPIILRLDSGFFDQKLFKVFEELGIGYLCGGKLYEDIKGYVSKVDHQSWRRYECGRNAWTYVELGDRRESWDRYRRAFFCRPLNDGDQLVMEFARPDTMIYTNLGRGEALDKALIRCGREDLLEVSGIIGTYHDRGNDELVYRAFKEFGFEELPFKRFVQNAAVYYTMLTAFFLYECFKEDVCAEVVQIGAYATTLRRKVIDIAAKIVRHGGKVILKVTATTYEQLKFLDLWTRSGMPPQYQWTQR